MKEGDNMDCIYCGAEGAHRMVELEPDAQLELIRLALYGLQAIAEGSAINPSRFDPLILLLQNGDTDRYIKCLERRAEGEAA